jgi:hypothetical protein
MPASRRVFLFLGANKSERQALAQKGSLITTASCGYMTSWVT